MTARTREWMHERARQTKPWFGQDMVDLVDTLYHRHEQLPVRLDSESTRQVIKDVGKALGVGTAGTFVTPKDLQDAIDGIEKYQFPGLPENHVAIGDGLNKPLKSTPRFTTLPDNDGVRVHVKIDDDILLGGDILTGQDGFTIRQAGTDTVIFGPNIVNIRRTLQIGADPTEDAGGEGYDTVIWGDTFLKNSLIKPELPLFKRESDGLLYSRRLEEVEAPWTRGASVAAGTIMIGDPVAATGQDFGVLAMNTALAATPARSWMLGVSAEGGYPGEISGYVRRGPVEFDTQSFTGAAGSQLWLQPAGGLNTTKPSISNATRNVIAGTLLVKAELGKIYVDPVNFPFLHELSGVNAAAPADKQVLMYDAPSNQWIASAVAGAGLEPTITPGTSSQVWLGTKTWGQVADAQVATGAAIAWSKISKSGAAPGDVGAAPAFTSAAAGLFWSTPAAASGVPSLRAIVASDLPNSGVSNGGYGSATTIPVLSIDAKGRITAASSVTVTPAWADITGKPAVIGTVTSVGLNAPTLMTASGSPVTGSGSLSLAWNGSSTNLVRADGTTIPSSTFVTGGPYLPATNPQWFGLMKSTAGTLALEALLAGGILKATAGTGVLALASVGDFPTLNQNTTGNAATATKWATARNLTIGASTQAIDGTSDKTFTLAAIGAQAAGTYLTPSNVSGAANQLAFFTGANSVSSDIGLTRSIAGGVTNAVIVGHGSLAAETAVVIQNDGSLDRDINFKNANVTTWSARTTGISDNWVLRAHGIDDPITVARAGGSAITFSRPLYMPNLSIWGTARAGDGGRWTHYMGGGTGGVGTGTSNALIQRYQYAGFSGFVRDNAEFLGLTTNHQYSGPGAQLSIVAGHASGRISFFVGTPTLQASGNYQAPRVGDWTNSGLSVTGTLSATSTLAWGGGGAIGSSANVVQGQNSTRTFETDAWTSALPSGFYQSSSAGTTPSGGWCHMIAGRYTDTGTNYQSQIATDFWNDRVWFRRIENGSVKSWREFWHSGNMANDGPWLPLTGNKTVTGLTEFTGGLRSGVAGIGTSSSGNAWFGAHSASTSYGFSTDGATYASMSVPPTASGGIAVGGNTIFQVTATAVTVGFGAELKTGKTDAQKLTLGVYAPGVESGNVAPNGFSRVTIGTSGTTLLPTPTEGMILVVQRVGTAPASYYIKPASGHTVSYVDLGGVARIMNNSATNGLTLGPVGSSLMFVGVSSTQWGLIGAWPTGS